MANGLTNGPNYLGSCPAPINMGYKVDLGWVVPEIIPKGSLDKTINFDIIYKVEIYGETNQYFLLNFYKPEGFYEYTPTQASAAEIGLSIWHWHKTNLYYDWAEVELASTSNLKFPSDKNGLQSFNDYSSVNSRKRDGTLSDVAINDIDIYTTFSPITDNVMLDVLDPVPQTPQNFSLSGNVGQSPTLSWDANSELDLSGYKLYQSVNGSAYSVLITLYKNTTSYTDNGITIGDRFDPSVCYKLTSFDLAGGESDFCFPRCTTAGQVSKEAVTIYNKVIPEEYSLFNAYPNPFNPTTVISYAIPTESRVKIEITNMLGQSVKVLVNDNKSAGYYEATWNAENFPSGIYLISIKAEELSSKRNFVQVKKALLLK